MKDIKKNLAILLCICMICQTTFVSYAAVQLIKMVQIRSTGIRLTV